MGSSLNLQSYISRVQRLDPLPWTGEVVELAGMLVKSAGPVAAIGDFLKSGPPPADDPHQVVGFRNGHVLSMPLEEPMECNLRDPITARSEQSRVGVGPGCWAAYSTDSGSRSTAGPRTASGFVRPASDTGQPDDREHITQPLKTGIRAIDSMLPCGRARASAFSAAAEWVRAPCSARWRAITRRM